MSFRHPRSSLPARGTLLDLGLAAYFVVLAAALPAVTPVLADAAGDGYDVALRTVALVVALGYGLGLAVLLRLQ